MKLDDYLARIQFEGPLSASASCLAALHRRHLLEIPYENVDVQLLRPLDLDLERIFEKLVTRRRGGWCYEMNGLFGWALREIGFEVTRMVGGVSRSLHGDAAMGNHLVLRVDLDAPMLADVGLGDGLIEPIPLVAGRHGVGGRDYALESLGDGEWRFRNHPGVIPTDFDLEERCDEALLSATCAQLQADPESLFRQNLICMQPDPLGGTRILLGRVLLLPGCEKRILEDASALKAVLRECFGIVEAQIEALWERVAARHDALFAADGVAG